MKRRFGGSLYGWKINAHWLGQCFLTLGLFLSTPCLSKVASAIPLGNGRTFFERGPSLIRSAASSTSPETPSDYEFTIVVPSDAGEPMKAVTITQKPNLEQIHFDTSKSRAFIGNSFAGGPSVALVPVNRSSPPDESRVTVVFDKPIEPGLTVTVSIHAKQNPLFGGVYLFGVTAFSAGENSPGLYLGPGRIHFTSPGLH